MIVPEELLRRVPTVLHADVRRFLETGRMSAALAAAVNAGGDVEAVLDEVFEGELKDIMRHSAETVPRA
jgi:hypothetical protein